MRAAFRTYFFRLVNALPGVAFAYAFEVFLRADRLPGFAGPHLAMLLDPYVAAASAMALLALASVVRPRPLLPAAAVLGVALAGYHVLGGAMMAASIRPWPGIARIAVCLAAFVWACRLLVVALPLRRPR